MILVTEKHFGKIKKYTRLIIIIGDRRAEITELFTNIKFAQRSILYFIFLQKIEQIKVDLLSQIFGINCGHFLNLRPKIVKIYFLLKLKLRVFRLPVFLFASPFMWVATPLGKRFILVHASCLGFGYKTYNKKGIKDDNANPYSSY